MEKKNKNEIIKDIEIEMNKLIEQTKNNIKLQTKIENAQNNIKKLIQDTKIDESDFKVLNDKEQTLFIKYYSKKHNLREKFVMDKLKENRNNYNSTKKAIIDILNKSELSKEDDDDD